MEQGFRPLKAGKMHPNALKTLPSGAAHRLHKFMLSCCSFHLFMLRKFNSSATLLSPPGGTGG
jgi:hypothetical protein